MSSGQGRRGNGATAAPDLRRGAASLFIPEGPRSIFLQPAYDLKSGVAFSVVSLIARQK